MENFVLKRHEVFRFSLEDDPGVVYELPPVSALGFDDVESFSQLKDSGLKEQGEICKTFILKYAPDIEKKNIGDMEYMYILQAYMKEQGQLGEF